MEEAEARRAVRKALSEARANSLFSSVSSSLSSLSSYRRKKSEQTLAFAKLTDTLGECLEKMKEKDVLSTDFGFGEENDQGFVPRVRLGGELFEGVFGKHGGVSRGTETGAFLCHLARKFKRESESYASDD